MTPKKQTTNNMSNYDNRLREFLMTTFLVITVFELVAKPIVTMIYHPIKCNDQSTSFAISFFNEISCFILNKMPKYGFGNIAWAEQNLMVIMTSLVVTGIVIWGLYKVSKFLYEHKKIKEYMNSGERKKFHTDDFGAILLLCFFLLGVVLCFLYPLLGVSILIVAIMAIANRKKILNSN